MGKRLFGLFLVIGFDNWKNGCYNFFVLLENFVGRPTKKSIASVGLSTKNSRVNSPRIEMLFKVWLTTEVENRIYLRTGI